MMILFGGGRGSSVCDALGATIGIAGHYKSETTMTTIASCTARHRGFRAIVSYVAVVVVQEWSVTAEVTDIQGFDDGEGDDIATVSNFVSRGCML